MNIKNVLKGAIIAGSVGLLFACGGDDTPTDTSSATKEVKCQGINDCKGHSDCAGTANDCKGLNDCKGTGYLVVASDKDCTDKGGKVI